MGVDAAVVAVYVSLRSSKELRGHKTSHDRLASCNRMGVANSRDIANNNEVSLKKIIPLNSSIFLEQHPVRCPSQVVQGFFHQQRALCSLDAQQPLELPLAPHSS